MRGNPAVLGAAGLAALLGMATPALASAPDVAPDQTETVSLGADSADRMTVAVSISGGGPYRFVVDTGAERTVISSQLAQELGLRDGRTVRMHSINEVGDVRTVVIPSLELTRAAVKGINAPALDRVDLGAAGMLGIDSLKSQRVLLDFQKGEMTVGPSVRHERDPDPDVILVKARSRFGQLVLVDASVSGLKVNMIVDTGSPISIGSLALRRRVERRNPNLVFTPLQITDVTGRAVMAEVAIVHDVRIGTVTLRDLPIAFVDAVAFRKFGLGDKPAVLLGMSALRAFDRVAIDFANRQVRFLLPDGAERDQGTRLAAAPLSVHGRDDPNRALAIALK